MTANINVRINYEDKINFENFCKETGMNVSRAINMFIKNVLKEKKLPFTISSDPFYSEKNIKRLEAAKKRMDKGLGKYHELIEA